MGRIQFNNQCWFDQKPRLPTYRRNIAYVFQENSLLDHLSVQGNINFARKRSRNEDSTLYKETLSILGIGELLGQQPQQLSVGQQQRVAIACAILSQPGLLLMDEPLASLDANRKKQILAYLKTLKSRLSFPVIYVSHALDEIAFLADHVLYMEDGHIIEEGSLQNVLTRIGHEPARAHDYGGVLCGEVCGRDKEWALMHIQVGQVKFQLRDSGESIGEAVQVHLPAHNIGLSLTPPAISQLSYLNILPAQIINIAGDDDPAFALVELEYEKQRFYARITRFSAQKMALATGVNVYALIKSAAVLR